jgi:hypothetical protein
MHNEKYNEDNEEFNREYNNSSDNDDDFGLSDANFEAVDRSSNKAYDSKRYQGKKYADQSSNTGLIVTLVVIFLALAGGAVWYFFFNKPEPQPVLVATIEEPVKEEEPVWEEPVVEEPVVVAPAIGTITRLTDRIGRAHVIVGSFFDEDNVVDYSNKLAKEGVNCKIIPPSGKSHFYRLSVQDFETYAEAMAHAEELKSKFTTEVWVLKF